MEKKILKYRWWIITASVVLTVALTGMLSSIKIDPDLKNYFPDSMESMVNTEKIEEVFGNQDIIMLLFEKDDIINEESLSRIKMIDRKLKRIKGIQKTTSLFGANRIYGEDGVMYVEPTIKRIPKSEEDIDKIKEIILDNEMVKNVVVADDFRSTAIIATLGKDAVEDSVFASITQILDEYPGTEKIHYGGLPYLRQAIGKDVKRDGLILVPIALFLMTLFLFVVFREWRGVVLPFLVVIMSSILALALLPMIGWKFYIITLLVPVMLIAVANDYGIHIIAKYQEINATNSTMSMRDISKEIIKKLWKPILLTGLTTIGGLAALLAHTMIPARQMAVIAGLGILFALFYSIVLLPGILSLMKRSKPVRNLQTRKEGSRRNFLNRLAFFIIAYHKKIPYAALIITLIIGSGIIFLKVDSNEENFFPEKHAVKQAARLINSNYGGSENLSVMIHADMLDPEVLKKIDDYKDQLKELPDIDLVMAFPDVVKQISKALNDPGTEYYDKIPPSREGVAQYIELYNMNGDPENLDQLVDFNYENSHMIIRIKSVSNKSVNNIIAFIKEMTKDDTSIAAIGGYGFVRAQLADKVVKGQFYSLSIAIIIIFILLSLIFRSLTAGLISSIPILMSIVLVFGIMGLTGVRLDVATALLSSVMIGVGVDYTIHFLWRYREERQQHRPPKEAVITTLSTTGRGILFNAMSVIVGFFVLIFSSFTPIRFFGVLVVVSIIGCLIGALVVLPALVLNERYKFLEPTSKPVEKDDHEELKVAI
jgi:uncharacterized protein